MHPWFSQQRVRHLFQEVRPPDLPIIEYYYDNGYHCKDSTTGSTFYSKSEAQAWISGYTGPDYFDVYCTLVVK
jgi:hypothetical protein